MQAKDVHIGKDYAISRLIDNPRFSDPGEPLKIRQLVRLRVSEVKSVRTSRSTKSFATGVIVEDVVPDEGIRSVFTILVDDLLGPYDQHHELVERERAEKEARKKAEAERDERARELSRRLYNLAGVPVPNMEKYNDPFRPNHRGVDISEEGVILLTNLLKNL